MIEFTISRVVLGVCGIVLLSAILLPVSSLYEDSENVNYQQQCDNIAEMLDAFFGSDVDTMQIAVNQILPDSTTLRLNGHNVTIISDEAKFTSITANNIVSEETDFNNNDLLEVMKDIDGILVKRINL